MCRRFLHTEALLAVAQRRWLFVYDGSGLELNCLKAFKEVLRMQFLQHHLLLATAVRGGNGGQYGGGGNRG